MTVFKYLDGTGNVFVSARNRSAPFVKDNDNGKMLSAFMQCLSKLGIHQLLFNDAYAYSDLVDPPCQLPLKMETLPQILYPLNFDVQSVTCEMFGSSLGHLVKYPYDVKMKVYWSLLLGCALTI